MKLLYINRKLWFWVKISINNCGRVPSSSDKSKKCQQHPAQHSLAPGRADPTSARCHTLILPQFVYGKSVHVVPRDQYTSCSPPSLHADPKKFFIQKNPSKKQPCHLLQPIPKNAFKNLHFTNPYSLLHHICPERNIICHGKFQKI